MKKKKMIAQKILDFWIKNCVRKKKKYYSRHLEYEIGSLNPGVNTGNRVYDFYLNKISLCLVILGGGFVIIVLYLWNAGTSRIIAQDRYLKREAVGGIEKTVVLDAQVGNTLVKGISIPVMEKHLSKEEAEGLLEEIADALPARILGENESLTYVDKPLELVNSWDETPVSIFWDTSDYTLLQNDGSIGNTEIPMEGVKVTLTATLSCEEVTMEKQITVILYPEVLSEEEKVKRDLLMQVEQMQDNSKTEDYLELPSTLGNVAVIWKEPFAELLPVLILLLLGAVAAVFMGKDRELHKEYEERNRRLLLEYPEFVSKLQLLLCCGMSIRSAFIRIGSDYQKSLRKGGKKQYVCEELLLAVRKMENGMGEAEALEYFGSRCPLFCYKKLVALILQNFKRGSEGLRNALLCEVKNAFEERKQTTRRMGEEAGTKLLLPMMLMMSIVLVIIVVPAYFSFGGI